MSRTNPQSLSGSQWAEISALFDELSSQSEAAIDARIGSAQLTEDGEALLRQMLGANGKQHILDRSIDGLAEQLLQQSIGETHQIPDDLIGRQFGAWTIHSELARGGMGAVFLAERTDGQFEKTVALKIIKPGAYSDYTGQRFTEEMQTLARLEHPNIARLIDGGISEDDIPYFVMEYVEGEPITAYADRQKLGLRSRVELICQVCAAVEHAHRNLIVHGDLKPSNILVNHSGEVRLVDFGIARSLKSSPGGPELPQFTPKYASPEQAVGGSMTTASDVFGLCAVLYELCCGMAPRNEQATTTLADFRASLRLPTPTPLEQYNRSAEPAQIAAQRQSNPRQLRRRLRGDLAWILRHGLAVDPGVRLHSASELRADLKRWLSGHPVESHPPSGGYRLRRWAGRHKLPLGIAATALAGLSFAGVSVVEQTQVAREQSAKAQWSNEFLLGIFEQADPVLNQQKPITVNELTDGAARRLLEDTQQFSPALKLEAAAVLGPIQRNLGQFQSAAQLTELQLDLALDGDDEQLAEALIAHGESLTTLDQLLPAAELFAQALELIPLDDSSHPLAVNAAQQRAMLLARVSQLDEAESLVAELLQYEEAILGSAEGAVALSLIYATKSTIERDLDRGEQALASVQIALDYAHLVGEDSRTYADALASLAALHSFLGDSEAAAAVDRQVVEAFERLYGPDHPLSIESKSELAVSLSQLGKMEQALEMNQAVLAGYRATLGNDNQSVAGTLTNIGAAHRALGNFAAAASHYEESLSIWPRLSSPPPISIAATQAGYARVLSDLGRFEQGDAMFISALDGIERALGRDGALYARIQCFHATLLIRAGRLADAESILPSAYQRVREAYGDDSKRTVISGIPLAELRLAQGDTASARQLAQQALSVLDQPGLRDRHALEVARARRILATNQ